ncbi:MAG: hypothetical protein U0T83_03900 [Bacteriovoracaceae bacterium]
MKNIILFIFIVIISKQAFSLDLDTALSRVGTNSERLRAQGKKILLGEVTGIGKQIDLPKVEIYILKDTAFLKSEVTKFNIIRTGNGVRLANLVSIQVGDEIITAKEIKGAVIP